MVSLFLPSSTGIPNFYPVNSCTDIKLKDIPEDVFQRCSTTNSAIHCLPDENNNLGLSCFQVTWISKGKTDVPWSGLDIEMKYSELQNTSIVFNSFLDCSIKYTLL